MPGTRTLRAYFPRVRDLGTPREVDMRDLGITYPALRDLGTPREVDMRDLGIAHPRTAGRLPCAHFPHFNLREDGMEKCGN